ncbi:MAG: cation diffusion facilitator family transporter, partial [Candidatus Thermochlorobacter sp.]
MSRQNKKLTYIQAAALGGSLLIFVIKWVAYYLTHSNAILSDALESIVNVVAGALALFSVWWASQPRDESHPYGHGKIEYLTAGIEGVLIILAGITIIIKALYDIFLNSHTLLQIDTGLLIILVSSLLNLIIASTLIYLGKKHRSLAMEADGRHLMSDVYTSIGLVAGLVFIKITHLIFIDNIIA